MKPVESRELKHELCFERSCREKGWICKRIPSFSILTFWGSAQSHLPVLYPSLYLSETKISFFACLLRGDQSLWLSVPALQRAGSPV